MNMGAHLGCLAVGLLVHWTQLVGLVVPHLQMTPLVIHRGLHRLACIKHKAICKRRRSTSLCINMPMNDVIWQEILPTWPQALQLTLLMFFLVLRGAAPSSSFSQVPPPEMVRLPKPAAASLPSPLYISLSAVICRRPQALSSFWAINHLQRWAKLSKLFASMPTCMVTHSAGAALVQEQAN